MIREIGTQVDLGTVMRTSAGTLTNSPTLVLTVTAPDLTITAPVVTNTGTAGLYTAAVVPTQAGLYRYTWTASGAVVNVVSDQFTVVSTQRALVAGLEELKDRLRRTHPSDVLDDADLRSHLVASTDVVEFYVGGPLAPTQFTQLAYSSGAFFPNYRPLISVTSVTPYQGTAVDPGLYVVDGDMVVPAWSWAWGTLPATFVYTAGLAVIPERVKRAGLELSWHLWLQKNGTSGRGFPGSDETTVTVLGYAVPRRVVQLLAPDETVMCA